MATVALSEEHYVYECGGGVAIRELVPVAADDARKAFRERAEHDLTGWTVWASSVILARFAEEQGQRLLGGSCVVDLGAGAGLGGLAVALCCSPTRVVLTDYNATTLGNLEHNTAANRAACASVALEVQAVDWDEPGSWPDTRGEHTCVVGADLLYRRSYARKVASVVQALVSPGGCFVCASPAHREGLPVLQGALLRAGWACEQELQAPPEWRENPLRQKGGADGECGAQREAQRDGLFPELGFRSLAYPLLVQVWRRPS